MSETAGTARSLTRTQLKTRTNRMKNLAAPLIAILAVICCVAAPLLVAGIGSIVIGPAVGLLVGAIVFAVTACLLLLKRTKQRC